MKATAEAQRHLLDLQTVDTTIARLNHQRRTLPELAAIAAASQQRQALNEEIVAARTRVSDLEIDLADADANLVPVRERQTRNQQRVDDGSITDGKQLRFLLDEIENIKRRIVDLEDIQLELMERLEASQGELAELMARREAGDEELRALLGVRDAKLADLANEIDHAQQERAQVATHVPDDLLKLYSKIAERSGGVGAAHLKHGRCGGCQLQITPADLNRFRAAADDEVLRCEECSRILVRTAESGL